jgi:hypothetical protein
MGVPVMRGRMMKSLILGICLCGLGSSSVLAANFPDNGRIQSAFSYPGAPKRTPEEPKPPYPMNYTDEAAQTLGVKDGRWDLFSSHPASKNGFMPSISGSLGGNGAMLRLQWHPGE